MSDKENSSTQIFAQQTESVIAAAAGTMLSGNVTLRRLPMVGLQLGLLLVFSNILKHGGEVIKYFSFFSSNSIYYIFQTNRYSERKTTIYNNGSKYIYNEVQIAETRLRHFLNSYNVSLDSPATYYFSFDRFIIKISVCEKSKDGKETIGIIVHTINNPAYHEAFMKKINDLQEGGVNGKTVQKVLPLGTTTNLTFENIKIGACYENPAYTRINESLIKIEKIGKLITPIKVPICLSFNGPPGTGKTSYLISSVLNEVYEHGFLINMIDFVRLDFTEFLIKLKKILTDVYTSSIESKKILLMFDEVDKWLKMRNDAKVKANRDESRKIESNKVDGKEETKSARVLTKEEEEEDKQFQRNLFLKQLQQFLNGSLLNGFENLTIILNTNNSNELFGNVSYEHESLINRINRFSFGPFNKQGVIHYLKFLAEKLKESGLPFEEITEEDYDTIPEDIQISCRTLSNYFAAHSMNVLNLIHYLSNEVSDHVTSSRFVKLICE